MAKHIFVTGGVVSSLGKGLTSASIGMLLERRGLRVRMQKMDPYINVDPGTMSPYQHGEVYVLDDGAETDLDLGHYERFTHAPLNKDCNYTTGKIYLSVIEKERRGDYKGKTVQVIPHITDEIKSCIRRLATPDVDVVITEIGGTVGDIEGMPYYEAIRQFALDVGRNNCLFIHLTLVPYLKAAGELKTKPTQHSVMELRKIGIQPDVLICRTEREIPESDCEKIAQMCSVERRAVIEEKDKELSIYEVPLGFAERQVDELIADKLGLSLPSPIQIDDWRIMLERIRNPANEVTVGFVGKYVKHRDAYKSVYESLDHAGIHHNARVRVVRIDSEKLAAEGAAKLLGGVDGLLVPGGFDKRGIEGKIEAIRYARENGLPFFGICLGLQCATIEFARNVVGLPDANSTEFNNDSPPGRVPARRAAEDHPDRRDDAARSVRVPAGSGFACTCRISGRSHFGAAPPPLRGEQRLPRETGGGRHAILGHESGRLAGGGDRVAGPSVVRRHPEPPGVQVEADPAAPALPRLHRRRSRTPPSQKRGR